MSPDLLEWTEGDDDEPEFGGERVVTFAPPTGETVTYPIGRGVRLVDVEPAVRESLT